MDIPALSINMAQNKTSMSIGIAVAKMGKEIIEQQGAEMVKLVSSASVAPVQLADGCNLDISI